MNKVNILFVHYLENIGGGERYLINVINSLPEYYNIFLLTPNKNTELEKLITRPITKISKNFYRNIGPFPAFSISLFLEVRKIIKINAVDIIHINDHYLLPALLFFKIKLVFTSHGLWDTYFLINRYILKILDPVVITATKIQYNRIKNLVSKHHLLPFFNIQEPKNSIKQLHEIINLGIVGRFSPVKNHQYAFNILKLLNYSYILNVYGAKILDLKEESSLYESGLIKKMKEDKRIIYHGFTPDIEKIYTNIDILLITSKTESFSMVTIEALSYGIPVVSTVTEGSSSLISNGYNGFVCHNQDDFIEKINIIQNNYENFSKNAYKNSKKYTKELYMKRLIKIYEN